jgi:uncharacterized protein (TIGR02186 family)
VTARRGAAAAAALLLSGAATGMAQDAAAPVSFPFDDPERERIVSGLSQTDIAITATFEGSKIFVYGAIERDWFPVPGEPAADVIVSITGPSEPVTVRKKEKAGIIWVNAQSLVISAAPSFYAVAATGPLEEILRPVDDTRHKISIDQAVTFAGLAAFTGVDVDAFRRAVIRLRERTGLYHEAAGAVRLRGPTLFETSVELPANIVEGDYAARVFLLREGRVRDVYSTVIAVRKTGLERLIYTAAQDQPLIYGILSIFVALMAGWGASEAFRQLRR